MIVEGLGPADRASMAAALRRGEPVRLELRGPVPRGVRLDEIAPLCYASVAHDPTDRRVLEAFSAPAAKPGSGLAVTVVIPCHRGNPAGVAALQRQDVAVRVIVLSNGPDGPERVPGAEVIRVDWEGHGRTRQRGISWVNDPYVLFLVDDAIPLGAGFLRTMVEALEEGGWDAVTARQVPWPDADRVTSERLRRWTPAGHRVVPFSQVDNVASLYRTETLRRAPFPDVDIAEDAWWSQGKRIGYVPHAPVLHSHARDRGALYRRSRDIHAELVAMGQPPAVPGLAAVMSNLPGLVRPSLVGQRGEWRNQLAELVGQWMGARDGLKRRQASAGKGRKR